MITNKVDIAAYLNAIDFEIGKAIKNTTTGMVDIEIKGDKIEIEAAVNDYNAGRAKIDPKKFYDSLGFIKYLVKQKA